MKYKNIFNPIIIITLFYSVVSYGAIRDSFNEKKWSSWGNSIAQYDRTIGHNDLGSLYIYSLPGQEGTFYREFKSLKNGYYKATFWVKGERVQKGKWGRSFWTFHNGGSSEVTCFDDLKGSFDWSQITCSINVTKGHLDFWFRLKSTGKVWVDDFSLKKTKTAVVNSTVLNYVGAKKIRYIKDTSCYQSQEVAPYYLLEIRKGITGPFGKAKVIGGRSAAELKKSKFYNFDLDSLLNVHWEKYDFLEFDVYIPDPAKTEIQGAFEDSESTDYWSKLNFKSSLVMGWNSLRFPLHRNVGERGSFKFIRKIDYLNLFKFWIVLDPDNISQKVKKAYIANIRLSKRSKLKSFKQAYLFDFVTTLDHTFPCFNPVSAMSIYEAGDDYGLIRPVEDMHDSIFTDGLNRDALLVDNNEFIAKVPNGDYILYLNWNMLGYWEPPFWHKRVLSVQGKPLKAELRHHATDYIKDYLRFENIEPSIYDNPWELYLKEIFEPIRVDVTVSDGIIRLGLEGDQTGIALNWMALWPKEKKSEGDVFLEDLDNKLRDDFLTVGRLAKEQDLEVRKKEGAWPLRRLDRVTPFKQFSKNVKIDIIDSVRGMTHFIPFAVRGIKNDSVKVEVTKSLSKCMKLSLYKGQYQYLSLDRNHESYILATKQLRPVGMNSMLRSGIYEQYIFKFNVDKSCQVGTYKGEVTFFIGTRKWRYPITVNVLNYSLPKVDFPVGFLGLSSIKYDYFMNKSNEDKIIQSKRYWIAKYLKAIANRGFTTWSGIPSNQFGLAQFSMVNSKYLKIGKTIFSYGGEFSFSGLLDKRRWKSTSQELKNTLSRWPEVIYTFSDEASGYQDRVAEDIKIAKILKKRAPFLKLGGFSTMDKYHSKLNKLFDVGSYSNYNKEIAKSYKNWGLYNLSSRPTDNPRFPFGVGLFILKERGASHLLGWNMSASQNYPYYDLDGRENDAMMLYPSSSGELYSTIKFEQAFVGLQDYRLLTLLKNRALHNKRAGKRAMRWLNSLSGDNDIDKDSDFFSKPVPPRLSGEKIRRKVFYFLKNL